MTTSMAAREQQLPSINIEQLTKEAIERIPETNRSLMECQHLRESRSDLDTDFFGYFEKYSVSKEGVTTYMFFKWCYECAVKSFALPFAVSTLVARMPFMCLSVNGAGNTMLSDATARAVGCK